MRSVTVIWSAALLFAAIAYTGTAGSAQGATQIVPDEARKQLIEALGPQFLVFHDKMQEELKLSDDQKRKLEERLQEVVHDAMRFFETLQDAKPDERQKQHHEYRQKAQEKLSAFLKETLKEDQNKRLRQITLQREGAFSLGNPEIGKELQFTDEQRKQFMTLVQEMEGKIQPLIKEAQTKGNHEEIRPKAMKIRKEYDGKVAALLTDAQKKQWQEMLGKPFDLGE